MNRKVRYIWYSFNTTRPMNLEERLLKRVVKQPNGCWEWTGATREPGYGAIKAGRKVIDTHRVSFTLFKGEIPSGRLVCHTCDNRLCVNPDHLFIGTHKDNFDDAISKGRINLPVNKSIRTHPSQSAYRFGCRCEECKEIQRNRIAQYRAKVLSI